MNKGYTLIEMLVVLLIVTVAISIPLLSFQSYSDQREIDYFLDTLAEDLQYAQQYAYARQKYVYVTTTENHYYIRDTHLNVDPLKQRKIPKGITFEGTLALHDVAYNANGNIRKPGTVLINTPKANYKLVFQLGKGRFYIEKR
ncbi:competence protein ComGD [Alteribacillus persepolensis]|uniref:Competence protein ComGD n=1 Tax=Alteribacillus persepolensis TaxID=568899 RepID=A0A1G8CX19_9BACI|nr:competence type IV pilus minor pilin ComGD [Alteribacillus persepolensis]SDH49992.1 competence protein ComGD [Alteribacillus persepolensis]